MAVIISPETSVQMLNSTWESFQWWYSLWQWTSIIEAIAIVALIIYLGRNHWKPLGASIINSLKNANNALNKAQREHNRRSISTFDFGKFWAFVFSGLFTFMALCCNLIIGYFAAFDEGVATANLPEVAQVIASNSLLWRLGFIQNVLYAIFVISLLVIFRDYIELLWQKLKEGGLIQIKRDSIKSWIFQGLRYSILILFTIFLLLVVYCLYLNIQPAVNGGLSLTTGIARNLALGSIESVAFGFIMFWICSIWLMAFGYLLRYEFDLLWKLIKQLFIRIYERAI